MEAAARVQLAYAVEGRPRLGALLLRDGVLAAGQLEAALAEAEATGRRLGELVLERGWVTHHQLARALAEQHALEYLDLSTALVDPAAATLLPGHLARRYCALPIRFLSRDTVLVAVADPTNVMTSDELRMALGHNVRFAVGTGPELERALARHVPGAAQPAEEALDVSVRGARPSEARGETADVPAVRLVNALIGRAIADGASDVHFEPASTGLVVRARVDGVMRRLRTIPADMQASVTSRLKVIGELDIAERRAPQDGRVSMNFEGSAVDVRIAVLPTTHGEQVVLRLLHRGGRSLGLRDLGMAEDAARVFEEAIGQPYGAVVACGPTGSGKTTTLYSALDLLNEDERVLMTIEDPVEYRVEGVNQIEVNPRAGLTFAQGLRTILRSDPDVLLVGEIRDEETARIAVQAALTGHLVLTTLHSYDAPSAIARLKDMGVSPALLATAVSCVVAQRLARRLCFACREPYAAEPEALRRVGWEGEAAAGPVTLHRARGCGECAGTGHRGRVAIYELMPITGRIRELIERSTEEIYRAAVADGMRTLRQDALRLCLAGVCSLEEVRRVTGTRLG